MRIAVIGPTYPFRGGIAHYTTLLVRALRQAGHEVNFLSFTRQYPRWLFPGRSDRDPSRHPLREACQYLIDPLRPLSWPRVAEQVRAAQPDLVVLQWWVPYWAPLLATLISRLKRAGGPPLVVIAHNLLPHDGGGRLDRWLTQRALRQADAVCVHSQQEQFQAQQLVPHVRSVMLRMPAFLPLVAQPVTSDERVQLRRRLAIPAERRVLLFFGFVRPYKGLALLIDALAAAERRSDLQLLVVGEIWRDRSRLEYLIRRRQLTAQVTFVNRYVMNEELPALFSLADALVLPYLSASQSAVAPLALAAGKPVITTRVGGLPELVRDNIDGLVVPPRDSGALAAALDRLADPVTAARLTAAAVAQTAQRSADWPRLVAQLAELAAGMQRS